ncbi:adhesion G protein-coupled receptor F4 [Periophthalmus magnuspinnatus]|uniref:adhesion G protein-coupled receptor F4 n=1 Tax=Periophthalmus magnuspinnatus TaxID=409849 RepID=UPI002436B618|nr:adhesion G protein-coupled receptor F4 [Periophthalmus magnuspinnatus]XP_055088210.1 adhesion G protein-coupled receptor F4 [Periophthalmus magnuspinnatus]
MWARGFVFLIGAFYFSTEILHSQHVSAQDIYVAELMVESNVTLEAATILGILNNITTLTVTDALSVEHQVTFMQTESVAECLIVGLETACNCSAGYIWSNEICYNYNCCRETTCYQNVSYISPLCIPKIPVYINGSVTMNTRAWAITDEPTLKTEFEKLNGFESLNITGQRLSGTLSVADFEVGLSVKFETYRLQDIINTLQSLLAAYIRVDTTGLVHIESPQYKVCYQSSPILKCTFDEVTHKAGWNMSTTFERFELNNGSVVLLDHACGTLTYPSCVAVTLQKVTGVWEGTYECGFTKGSVRHIAKAYLSVARLPDTILLTTNPITGDCSALESTSSITIKITTTIPKTNNSYVFNWNYKTQGTATPVDAVKNINYIFNVMMSCVKVLTAQTVSVTFKNDINQTKTASVTIPVIYGGAKFCPEETINGAVWPKTPAGDTAVNNTCPVGRVGFQTRTCTGTIWDQVFDFCVNQELNKISNAAESFLKGMGATEDVALDIFSGLNNNTDTGGGGDNIADLTASINVMDMMAQASKNVPLGEKVLPSFVSAASNMLNKTWTKVNNTVLHYMSANYLESLEGLVENIKVNLSNNNSDYNTQNLDLKYCSGDDCSVDVFGINVNLNKSSGIMKTVAVKNLMSKLRNTYKSSTSTDLLVSTTLEDNNDSNIQIKMAFTATPNDQQVPHCVFWNPKTKDFEDTGCQVASKVNRSGVLCECMHLTSFSVLMARGDVSDPVLDVITYVGLAVSIISLIIFLIIEYLVWAAVVKTKLSHYRHTCMVNIAFFLLLADISFLASVEPSALSADMCLALTICKHLFFMIKFCWMLSLSAMLVHQLIFVFNPLRKKVFMFFSSFVGYMVPIVIVGSSYIYYRYTGKPYHNKDTCWLTYESLLVGSLHAFLLPIGTILLSNIFSLGVVIVTLLKSSKNDSSKGDEKDTAKSIIKVILVLAPVFGVTWSIGFCLVVFNSSNPAYPFFNYTFTIVNSFQGFFVLLTGFMAEQKVKDELYKIVCGKGDSSDSTKNLTSTMYTKDK